MSAATSRRRLGLRLGARSHVFVATLLAAVTSPAIASALQPEPPCPGSAPHAGTGVVSDSATSFNGGGVNNIRCVRNDPVASVADSIQKCAVLNSAPTVVANVNWDPTSAVNCIYLGDPFGIPGQPVAQMRCTQQSHFTTTGSAGFPTGSWDMFFNCYQCTTDAQCSDGKACNGPEVCTAGKCAAAKPAVATCNDCPAGQLWDTPTNGCIAAASCTGTPQYGQCFHGPAQDKCETCDAANAKGIIMVMDPVHPGSGVSTQIEPIFASSTLALTLTYNSLPTGAYRPPHPYPFGVYWSHTYGARIITTTTGGLTVGALRPAGSIYSFNAPASGTRYVGDPDVSDTLDKIVDGGGAITGYRYTTPSDQTVELYDATGALTSITDRNGQVTTLTYSTASTPVAVAPAAGLLIQVSDDFGRSIALVYDATSRVSKITDPAGATTTFKYDEASANGAGNKLTSVTFPDTKKRVYSYNEAANVANAQPFSLTGLTDENGARHITWKFDASGRAIASQVGGLENHSATFGTNSVAVTDPMGATRTFTTKLVQGVGKVQSIGNPPCPSCGPAAQTFDANGYLTSVTDWNGNVTTFARTDARKHLETSRTEASGTPLARTITTTWHPTMELPVTVTEPGRTTTMTYDAVGNMLTLTLKDTATSATRAWTFTYDTRGRMVTLDGPRSDVTDATSYAYYADGATCAGASPLGCRGQLAAESDALGHLTQYLEYDAYGNPLTIKDPNGTVLTLTYDARQRVLSRSAGGLTTSYTYDAAGQVTRITMPNGAFVDMAYDLAHRLTDLTDNLGNRVKYQLDGGGNRTAETVFDAANAVTRKVARTFSNLGRLVTEVGALGQTTSYAYDTQGNVTSVTDPLNHTTTRAYDALHRLIKATNAAAGTTLFGYDVRDRLVSVTDPRNLVTQYGVDALGNVLTVTSPDTGVVTSTYDPAGNLVSRTDAKGQTTTYVHDALGRVTAIQYADSTQAAYDYDSGPSGIGHLTAVTDASGARAYLYDALGRMVQESTAITSGGNSVSLSLGYAYDATGHLAAMTYPNGQKVRYAYDALGRIGTVSLDSAGPSPTTTTLADLVTYSPFGPMTSFKTQSGSVLTRTVDLDGRIASYMAAGKTWTVSYDTASRITSIADAANATDKRTYGYDALDRLIAATSPAGAESYTYDAIGNRTTRGAQTLTYGATDNRLAATSAPNARTYAYDSNGSPTTDGKRGFAYDARGRLIKMTNGSVVADYLVGANGVRVAKTVTR